MPAPSRWRRSLIAIERWFFRDAICLFEWFSAARLFGFAYALATVPGLLERPTYAGFGALSAPTWALLFTAVAVIQLVGVVSSRLGMARILALCASAGLWTITAASFIAGEAISTAHVAYVLLATFAGFGAVYLALKVD